MKYTFTERESTQPQQGGQGRPARPVARPERRKGGFGWGVGVMLVLATLAAGGVWWFMHHDVDGRQAPPVPQETDVKPEEPQESKSRTAVTEDDVRRYLSMSEAEALQLYGYVVQSPHVLENLQYRNRVGEVDFVYVSTNDTVNAFAGVYEKKGKDGKAELGLRVVLFGGATRYARMVALAAALQDSGEQDMLKRFVAALPKSLCGKCPEDDCLAFIKGNGLAAALGDTAIRQRAVSYASGMIVSVLAHESGHQTLGHVLGTGDGKNLEISRNQEREADSFASSVISTSPFGEFIFAGTLFWHYAVAIQSDGDSDARRTHPLSRERFENFVRANAEKAAAMGISLK